MPEQSSYSRQTHTTDFPQPANHFTMPCDYDLSFDDMARVRMQNFSLSSSDSGAVAGHELSPRTPVFQPERPPPPLRKRSTSLDNQRPGLPHQLSMIKEADQLEEYASEVELLRAPDSRRYSEPHYRRFTVVEVGGELNIRQSSRI